MTSYLVFFLSLYLALTAGLYGMQRKLLYFPEKDTLDPAAYGLGHFERVALTAEDGTPLHAWYHAPGEGMPLVVYFHGNAGHLGHRADKFAAFSTAGLGVLALSYRGYGASEGTPTEEGLYQDARAALQYANVTLGLPEARILLYGESLGTGVAVEMAREQTVGMLVLEAPYTSVVNRAAERFPFVPVRWMLKDRFESINKIPHVTAPLLILHGERDKIIPVQHGRTVLATANEPKKGVFYDHVDHTSFDPVLLTEEVLAFTQKNGR